MKEKNALIVLLSCAVMWMGSQLWEAKKGSPVCEPGTKSVPSDQGPKAVPMRDASAYLPSQDCVSIDTPLVHGQLDTRGACLYRWDLKQYKASVQDHSPAPVLFQKDPVDRLTFGWRSIQNCSVPESTTMWSKNGSKVGINHPVTLFWTNRDNVTFSLIFSVDEQYMMTVVHKVFNGSQSPITLAAQSHIQRTGMAKNANHMIVHEGAIGSFGKTVVEKSYKDLRTKRGGIWSAMGQGLCRDWAGLTDKYWLTAVVPPVGATGSFDHRYEGIDCFDVSCRAPDVTLNPGQEMAEQSYVFMGPKKESILNHYKKNLSIQHFDMGIDYGRLFFLTKPLLHVLTFLKDLVGSFGWAILILTVLVKAALFPFSVKSYRSMARMRQLQPKMQALKERYSHDKVRLNQEMMALYKKEKMNPASGCLPMLVQAPIFFALYKVLFISIDMRHAGFLWLQDLSAPDTMWIFNGFGLLPWSLPSFLQIGLWPAFMALSMVIQQKMTPNTAMDAQQQLMLTYVMPVMFAFMMGSFPVGLVIYWTWNNLLTTAQQWIINKQYAQS